MTSSRNCSTGPDARASHRERRVWVSWYNRAATTAAADQVTAAVFHDQETIEALTTLGQTASLLVERLVGRGIERSQAIGTVVAAVATSVSRAGGGR